MAERLYNFSPGPATLPIEVLEQAQSELLNWHNLGMSVMEISHREAHFAQVAQESEHDLRELMQIPEDYTVLFIQGGGRGHAAMVPMNILRGKTTADYIDTGIWSKVAYEEAKKYCRVNIAASNREHNQFSIPDPSTWQLNPDAAYVHVVDNETIEGIEFPFTPEVGDVPLVSDMSSNILSRPVDVTRYGVIYAGAQKNAGAAGISIAIIRNDLLGQPLPITPTVFNYTEQAKTHSMYQTPPTFAWYVMGLVFKWVKKEGGLEAIAQLNQNKATLLYDFIDQHDFYHNAIDPRYRSRMNVVFRLADESKNALFLQEALKQGLVNLKGHQVVGGMRASLYNPITEQAVQTLVNFMADFAARHA